MDEFSATPAPVARRPQRCGFAIAWLTTLALLPALIIPSMTARAAFNNDCQSRGGDLECVAPKEDEWWWVAAVGAKGGDCAPGPGSPTGHHCVERGEALQLAEQAFRNTVAECSVQYSQQSETIQQYLGRDWTKMQTFDLTYTIRDDDIPACQTTVYSPAASAFTQASAYRPIWCPPTFSPDSTKNACVRPKCEVCRVGNPVQCSNGEKFETEVDIAAGPGSLLEFRRYYASGGFYTSANANRPEKVLGTQWRHSWQREVVVEQTTSPTPRTVAYVARPDGDYRHFTLSGSNWTGRTDKPETLEQIAGSGAAAWRYKTADNAIELYDAAGKLISVEMPDGRSVQLVYSDASTPTTIAPETGLLTEVVDQSGRAIALRYNARAMLVSVEDPSGAVYGYRYDLDETVPVFVDYPNTSTREYRYGEAGFVAGSNPTGTLLTGIIDENGQRFGSYKYDSSQRAYEEWHGASGLVERLVLSYSGTPTSTAGSTRMTDALGATKKVYFSAINGVIKETSTYRCGNNDPNCAQIAAQNSKTYDTNGNLDLAKDFRGTTTDHDYNTRGLEVRRRENSTLPALSCPAGTSSNASNYSSACTNGTCWKTSEFPGSINAASIGWNGWYYSCRLPPGADAPARTTETDWHASFPLPTERRLRNAANTLEAKTQWAYNSRGQLVARCEIDIADTAAMAYTCSDSVAPSASAKVRRWTYSYCEAADVAASNSTCPILGFAKTVNGPRASTDAGMNGLDDITTYAYYPSTDESGCGSVGGICHRKGDLHSVTNALGHMTENVAYDKAGRVIRIRDPNGTLTDLAYANRGWLTSRTLRALASGANNVDDTTTSFTYDNTGQVTRATQPDGTYFNYTYDDAHRLTDIVDNLNNHIHYTLDAAGNRIREETYDSSYNPLTPNIGLKRKLSREYNALSRLVKTLNATGIVTRDSTPYDTSPLSDGYDPSGNEVQLKDGLNTQAHRSFDSLNRLTRTLLDYSGSDPDTANSAIEQSYDARGNVRTLKDPENLTTSYTFDGLNNLVDFDSPDTGHTDYDYDLAGNRTSQTDNRGVTSTYTYDALNRVVGIAYPTETQNISYRYDQSDATTGCSESRPIQKPTYIADASGSTTYCYDRRGNIIKKTQIIDGHLFTTSYTYTRVDHPLTITYPSGGVASYAYDSTGRISALTWKSIGATTAFPVVDSMDYYPFGPAHKITYGNGRTITNTYDIDYVINTIASSATDGLELEFDHDVMANITSATGLLGGAPERQYVYDKLNRLTRVNDSNGAMLESYGYNKTGDRTTKQLAGQPSLTYTYLTGSHRLGSINGTSRNYDANGNTTNRGDGVTLDYDDRNRLATANIAANPTNYSYSGRDERTLKVQANGGTTIKNRYIYNDNEQIIADHFEQSGNPQNNTYTEYLLVYGIPIAIVRGAELSYIETDHLGTPRVAANAATNAKEWEWDLLGNAFGDNVASTIFSGKEILLRYPGQMADLETALFFNHYRYFEASTARYAESDPIGFKGGISTYSYAQGNPLLYIDPLGLAYGLIDCKPDERAIWWFPERWNTGGSEGARKTCIPRPSSPPPPPLCWVTKQCNDCEFIRVECPKNSTTGAAMTGITAACLAWPVAKVLGIGAAASPMGGLVGASMRGRFDASCERAYEGCLVQNKTACCRE